MSPATTRTIIGLVDAGGSGGVSDGQSDQWSLIFHLVGWRYPGREVVTGNRRCKLPVSKDDLRALMDVVGPYSIVEVEIDHGSGAVVTTLRRIVHAGAQDPELEQLALQLQKPIVLHDAILGRLEYNRRFGWFEGRAEWCGQDVKISLSCTRSEDPTAVLDVATRLFKEQARWDRLVREYAVEQLLPLKNDSWLDEDEEEISAAEFLSKMSLESISLDEEGDLTFWHNDGDLFWGHAIQISGNLTDGLKNADIPG
jgi:hypothetical protein